MRLRREESGKVLGTYKYRDNISKTQWNKCDSFISFNLHSISLHRVFIMRGSSWRGSDVCLDTPLCLWSVSITKSCEVNFETKQCYSATSLPLKPEMPSREINGRQSLEDNVEYKCCVLFVLSFSIIRLTDHSRADWRCGCCREAVIDSDAVYLQPMGFSRETLELLFIAP